jgi:hypothetical protein
MESMALPVLPGLKGFRVLTEQVVLLAHRDLPDLKGPRDLPGLTQ